MLPRTLVHCPPPPPAAFTTRVTVAECTRLPLVPVIVRMKVPAHVVELVRGGVEDLVETDSVELPEPATEAGLKLPLAPLGNPLTLNVTVPVKPFTADTLVA